MPTSHIFVLAVLLLFNRTASADPGNNALGALKKYTFQNGVFHGTTTNGQFRVTIYSPTIFRFQITKDNSFGDLSYGGRCDTGKN